MKKKDRRGSAEGSSQDALGPLQDLIRQLRSGARTKTQLVDFNEGRNPFVKKLGGLIFPVWKTIKLGTGLKTADDFRQALKASGFEIGNWANEILGKPAFTAAAKETEVELVRVSVAERGFKNGATRKDIYQRAQELGLELCPNEVGPQLRLQYKDQQYNEGFASWSQSLRLGGGLVVFGVGRVGGDQWLGGGCGTRTATGAEAASGCSSVASSPLDLRA